MLRDLRTSLSSGGNGESPLSDLNRRPLPYHEGAEPREAAKSLQTDVAECGGVGRGVALCVRSRFARPVAQDTLQTPPDRGLQALLGGVGDPVAVLRARVYAALLTPTTGCLVCGDPTGVRCCEHGAAKACAKAGAHGGDMEIKIARVDA